MGEWSIHIPKNWEICLISKSAFWLWSDFRNYFLYFYAFSIRFLLWKFFFHNFYWM